MTLRRPDRPHAVNRFGQERGELLNVRQVRAYQGGIRGEAIACLVVEGKVIENVRLAGTEPWDPTMVVGYQPHIQTCPRATPEERTRKPKRPNPPPAKPPPEDKTGTGKKSKDKPKDPGLYPEQEKSNAPS